MFHGEIQSTGLKALQTRIAEIDVAQAALNAEKMVLLVEQGRLEAEAAASVAEPYAVNAKWLIIRLGWSPSTFYATVRNTAKGFPEPVYATSDPQWLWAEVKDWMRAQRKSK